LYPSLENKIIAAAAAGVVTVAAAGNGIYEHCPSGNGGTLPYNAYPAAFLTSSVLVEQLRVINFTMAGILDHL